MLGAVAEFAIVCFCNIEWHRMAFVRWRSLNGIKWQKNSLRLAIKQSLDCACHSGLKARMLFNVISVSRIVSSPFVYNIAAEKVAR